MSIKSYSIILLILYLSFFNHSFIFGQEEEENTISIIHYDISDPNITVVGSETNEIEDQVHTGLFEITKIKLSKEGYSFYGWTIDGIYGYEPGDKCNIGRINATFIPLFSSKNDKITYPVKYQVLFEGEILETKTSLPSSLYRANSVIKIFSTYFSNDKAIQLGWTDGVNNFVGDVKMVMPRKNVTLIPIYHYYRKIIYSAGDVDGIAGNIQKEFTNREGGIRELSDGNILSRNGYNLVGWHCENDGKDYSFYYSYIMPDEDVVMTAIWEPIIYDVTFTTGVNSFPNIIIKGKTKEVINAPLLLQERQGYLFLGWLYEGKIYCPGDEIFIEGVLRGKKVSARAIWILN